MSTMDKEMQHTAEQDAGEYSNDSVLIWHIVFHFVFTSPSVLTCFLMSTLRMNTNNSCIDSRLGCVGYIHKLLWFGGDIIGVDDDHKSIFTTLEGVSGPF